MNWEAIGAIGEVVGAVAVVATLLYLAKETRTNTKAVVAASSRASNLGHAELDERVSANPEQVRIFLKSTQPTMAEFDEVEWAQFQFLARAIVGRIQDDYVQCQLGFQDIALAEVHLDFMRSTLKYPAWRTYWDDDAAVWLPDFVGDVEARTEGHTGLSRLGEIDSARHSE